MDEEISAALKKVRKKLILVEGKKDKNALEKLGCKHVVTLEGRALYQVVESIPEKNVVLLMDLDREGKTLYHTLKSLFERRGVLIDNSLRHVLFEHKIQHIESLH